MGLKGAKKMDRERREVIDKEDRKKITHDFSTTFWVEAGAGTGKTSLLIERLINLVTVRGAHLDRIVAVTFTEKAAGEIKERLREGLEQELKRSSGRIRSRIGQALREIEYAPIKTIHSFATSLLHERPVEAGIDPLFRVLDPEETDSFCHRAWDEWFLKELDANRDVLERALKYKFNEAHLKEMALLLYNHRDIVQEGAGRALPALAAAVFMAALEDNYRLIDGLAQSCINKDDKGYQQYIELSDWLSSSRLLRDDDLLWSIVFRMPKITGKGNKANWSPPEDCTAQKDICKRIQGSQEEIRRTITSSIINDIIDWLKDYLKYVEEEKREAGVLDFSDLMIKARDLLKGNTEIRGYFQNRFSHLLVDEFQDTDPLQAEIIFFLAEKEPLAASWNEVEITPGKLFIVGDPKQAIYRFRRADIEIYEEAKKLVMGQGEVVKITQNFRTVPSIINWVNHSFSHLITPVPGKHYQPHYEELHPYRDQLPGVDKSVIVLEFPEEVEECNAEEKRRAEAALVTSFIKEAVGSGMVIGGKENGRTLSWEDIGILFPSTAGLDIYLQALQRESIPYHLEGGKMFFRRYEVESFINLLTSLDNPFHSVALVSALKYFFGISDEELFLYIYNGGRLDYLVYESVPPRFKRIREAFAVMHELHMQKQAGSLSNYLQKVLHVTGTCSRLSLQYRGEQAFSNLEKIIEISRSLEQSNVHTLRQYIEWLKEKSDAGKEESESILSERDTRALQLITIHRSKGLEFNMVILVNLFSGGQAGRERFVADRLGGRFEMRGGPSGFSSYGFDELAQEEKNRLEAEKRRLFYVAATRARDYLVIPLMRDKKRSGYLEYIDVIKAKGGISREMCRIVEPGEELFEHESLSLSEVNGERTKTRGGEEISLPVLRSEWEENLQSTISRGIPGPEAISASALMEDFGGRGRVEYRRADEVISRGVDYGSAFHMVMERIDLHNPLEEDLFYHAQEAAGFWGLNKQEHEMLLAMIKGACRSQLIQRANHSTGIYREVPFALKFNGKIHEGFIDLVFEEPEGLVIVDYKTDDVSGKELENRFQRYRLQGLFYAHALNRVTAREIKEVTFFFVRPREVRTIEYPLSKPEFVQVLEDMLQSTRKK